MELIFEIFSWVTAIGLGVLAIIFILICASGEEPTIEDEWPNGEEW